MQRNQEGFNLVEVCLALMVVTVGIVAVLSMFPAGLDQNRRAMGEAQGALFAEEVFAGLRARAGTDWANLETVSLPVTDPSLWADPTLLTTVPTGPFVVTNIYRPAGATTLVDHAFRYQLCVQAITTDVKAAVVRIWDGEFGSATNPALIFYTEMHRCRF